VSGSNLHQQPPVVGWFGVLMIPPCWLATNPVHRGLRGRAPCRTSTAAASLSAGSLMLRTHIISGAVVPSSNAIGLHFYPIWESRQPR